MMKKIFKEKKMTMTIITVTERVSKMEITKKTKNTSKSSSTMVTST